MSSLLLLWSKWRGTIFKLSAEDEVLHICKKALSASRQLKT
jgi:hypothetical protein